jgi:hypothetical protein
MSSSMNPTSGGGSAAAPGGPPSSVSSSARGVVGGAQQQPLLLQAQAAPLVSHQAASALWARQPKAPVELFALTHGALVGELLRDLERPDLISAELDRMGHSMGLRATEELLASSQQQPSTPGFSDLAGIIGNAASFRDTASVLQAALKMFFGITADCEAGGGASPTATADAYSLLFVDNPFTLFVELPESLEDSLEYCALLAGWCRGCLELLQMDCTVLMKRSVLKGDAVNELSVSLNQVLRDGAGEDYQEE